MSAAPGPAASPPLTQTRSFWAVMAYAVVLGVLGAAAGLLFIGVIGFGDNWYVDPTPGWFNCQWWWIAVTAGAGVIVGVLRRLTHLPDKTAGLIADLQDEHVDPRPVPGIVAVSAVSLIGGASLGPEKALGSVGGGLGTWIARRRGLNEDDARTTTLAGFGGAYGGLFSSTVIVVMMIMRSPAPAAGGSPPPWSAPSSPPASPSGSTSPSPVRSSWTPTRCRSTSSRTGTCWPPSRSACSPLW